MVKQRTVPFFNYSHMFISQEKGVISIIKDVGRRGAFIMQKDLREFEERLAEYVGVKHAIGTADGTMALLMGLMASGIGPGDEVIVPSHTFVASVATIHHAGATPVLADCGPDHLIEADSVEELVTPRTRAIMPVQLNGRTADMDLLLSVAEHHNLVIVEDSCQALGSKFKGRFAGTFGISGAFSFFPSKTLGCFGDGGALVTNDDDVAEQVRLLRDHGRNSNGKVVCFGFNSRLDNLHAAILNFKLKTYDWDIARRRELATMYHSQLKDVSELMLPPPPDVDSDHYDIFQNYEIEAERRDELRGYLSDQGVGTILQWGGYAVHQFEKLGFDVVPPYAERMTRRFMLLPMNTAIADEDVDYVCENIIEFYHSGQGRS